MQPKGPIANPGTLLGSPLGPRRGEAAWLGEEMGGSAEGGSRVRAARDAEFGEKAEGEPKSWGSKYQQEQSGLRKRGFGERDPGSSESMNDCKGAQKMGAKKEVRNCGGGSRPWKGRGKGEARKVCLHFRGEGPESLPGLGLRRRR